MVADVIEAAADDDDDVAASIAVYSGVSQLLLVVSSVGGRCSGGCWNTSSLSSLQWSSYMAMHMSGWINTGKVHSRCALDVSYCTISDCRG